MRILIADQNALLLAAIASTFGRHCEIVTATRGDACIEHLERERFDVVVACEKLQDYTGLELLSEIETVSPHTLRIFAAPAPRLARLQSRLDHFRLLGTLSYPIEARKLLLALKVARTKLPVRPKVQHVVLESEWDTGERLGLLEQELEVAPADPPVLAEAASPPAAETPDDIPVMEADDASVSLVRRVREIPSAEVSFEVSFDQNPNRFDATATQARGVGQQARPGAGAGVQTAAGAQARNSTWRTSGAETPSGTPAAPIAQTHSRASAVPNAQSHPHAPAALSAQTHPHAPEPSSTQTRPRTSAGSVAQSPAHTSAVQSSQTRSRASAAPSAQTHPHTSEAPNAQTRPRTSAGSTAQSAPHTSPAPSSQTRSRASAASNAQTHPHAPEAPNAQTRPRASAGSSAQSPPHTSAAPSSQTRSRASAAPSTQAHSSASAAAPSGQTRSRASAGANAQARPHAPPAPSTQSPPPLPPSSPGHLLFTDEPDDDETVDVAFDGLPQDFAMPPANDPSVEEPPPPPPPPPVDTGGAANDPAFDTGTGPGPAEKTPARPAAKTAGEKTQHAPAVKTPAVPKGPSGPRPRKAVMPTAAQREAFQRAVARRNAARSGGAKANTNSWATAGSTGVQDHFDAPSAAGSLKPHWHGTHSLSDLAGMAATRRPLKPTHPQPNRKVVVVGSGIAAVLLASVLAFELTGSNATTHHGRRVSAAQLFSPKSDLVAQNTAEPAPIFAPPSPQSEQTAAPTPTASALPQPQVFDPDTAPPDPPPPPALEHPGPMEPPSMGHNDEPPVGMQGPTTD